MSDFIKRATKIMSEACVELDKLYTEFEVTKAEQVTSESKDIEWAQANADSLRQKWENLKFAVSLHGSVNYHLAERFYVIEASRYGRDIKASFYALDSTNSGPWYELEFAEKERDRRNKRQAELHEKNPRNGAITFKVVSYNAKTNQFKVVE